MVDGKKDPAGRAGRASAGHSLQESGEQEGNIKVLQVSTIERTVALLQ